MSIKQVIAEAKLHRQNLEHAEKKAELKRQASKLLTADLQKMLTEQKMQQVSEEEEGEEEDEEDDEEDEDFFLTGVKNLQKTSASMSAGGERLRPLLAAPPPADYLGQHRETYKGKYRFGYPAFMHVINPDRAAAALKHGSQTERPAAKEPATTLRLNTPGFNYYGV